MAGGAAPALTVSRSMAIRPSTLPHRSIGFTTRDAAERRRRWNRFAARAPVREQARGDAARGRVLRIARSRARPRALRSPSGRAEKETSSHAAISPSRSTQAAGRPGRSRSRYVGIGPRSATGGSRSWRSRAGRARPAIPFTEQFLGVLGPILQTRDEIVFDQRGTGLSGRLACRGVEHPARGGVPEPRRGRVRAGNRDEARVLWDR